MRKLIFKTAALLTAITLAATPAFASGMDETQEFGAGQEMLGIPDLGIRIPLPGALLSKVLPSKEQ